MRVYLRIAMTAISLAACWPWIVQGAHQTRDYGFLAAVPLAFPMLFLIALAAAPWAKAIGRFSLRGLFMAATVLAIYLGIIVGLMR
jgi:hypothetical protein